MMNKQEMIEAMMAFFETGQEIYGVCPCCKEIFRVSEMQIFYGKEPPVDWLTRLRETRNKLEEEKKLFEKNRDKIVREAIDQSIAVRMGKTLEHIAPIIPQLGHHPSDMRALLNPIDYVAFNGMFEKKDIDNISFIEIKTGKSSLTTIQRRIRDAIKDGRVEWRLYNITDLVEDELKRTNPDTRVLKDFT